jgi:hypothetical protein
MAELAIGNPLKRVGQALAVGNFSLQLKSGKVGKKTLPPRGKPLAWPSEGKEGQTFSLEKAEKKEVELCIGRKRSYG